MCVAFQNNGQRQFSLFSFNNYCVVYLSSSGDTSVDQCKRVLQQNVMLPCTFRTRLLRDQSISPVRLELPWWLAPTSTTQDLHNTPQHPGAEHECFFLMFNTKNEKIILKQKIHCFIYCLPKLPVALIEPDALVATHADSFNSLFKVLFTRFLLPNIKDLIT